MRPELATTLASSGFLVHESRTHSASSSSAPALDLVAGTRGSSLGAERVRAFSPRADRDWVEREHARVAAMRSLVTGESSWHPQQVPDIRPSLARLRVEGASLDAAHLLGVRESSSIIATHFRQLPQRQDLARVCRDVPRGDRRA